MFRSLLIVATTYVCSHTRFHTLHTCSALYLHGSSYAKSAARCGCVCVCVCRVSRSLMYFTAWRCMCILTPFSTSCFSPYTPAALFTSWLFACRVCWATHVWCAARQIWECGPLMCRAARSACVVCCATHVGPTCGAHMCRDPLLRGPHICRAAHSVGCQKVTCVLLHVTVCIYIHIYIIYTPCPATPFGALVSYGVATVSRLLQIIGIFCRISSLL